MGGSPGERPADGIGTATSDCGDRLEIQIWLDDGRVARGGFRVEGCQNTLAAGAAATWLARGRTPGEALGLQREELLAALEDLPPGTEHVADLALQALQAAVLDAVRTAREPWKRPYRRT